MKVDRVPFSKANPKKGPVEKGTQPASGGQGAKPFKGNFVKAQVTSLNKGGSKSKTGGKTGPSGKS